ncbi:MAG: hypothetical protein GXO83_13085 [Chlorobi bacterium]|nr:hypothetical protein [Chlorobiota bacterium]
MYKVSALKTSFVILLLNGGMFLNIFAQNDLQLLDLTNYVEFHNPDYGTAQSAYHKVTGSPYLYDDFKKGVLVTKNRQRYAGSYRYDIHDQAMEFRVNGIIYEVKDFLNIDTITIGDQPFIYLLAQNKKKDVQGAFYEVLCSGKCLLLARKRVELIPGRTRQAYAEPRPPHFTRMSDVYFLQTGIRAPQRITGKKAIKEYLADHEQEVAEYIRRHRISMRKPYELSALIDYYNRL